MNFADSFELDQAFKRAREMKNANYANIANNLKSKLVANIYFYGSRLMGVATEGSDLDIFVETRKYHIKPVVNIKQLQLFYYFRKLLPQWPR